MSVTIPVIGDISSGTVGTFGIDPALIGTDDDKTEKTLKSIILPVGVLGGNVAIRIKAFGYLANNVHGKVLRFYLGTNAPIELSALFTGWVEQNAAWEIELLLVSFGAGQQFVIHLRNAPNDFSAVQKEWIFVSAGVVDDGTQIEVKITGQNGVDTADDAIDSTNDILGLGIIGEYLAAVTS